MGTGPFRWKRCSSTMGGMGETKTLITADQLLGISFPDERVELSNGEVIRMPAAGWEHCFVAANVVRILGEFVKPRDLGAVATAEAGFKLSEYTLRVPDVSFVSKERRAATGSPVGFWPGGPDLAVEVVSPSDSASDLYKKIQQYFEAGTRMVWVLYPQLQQVHFYRGPKQMRVLEAHESISGEDVLPGFSILVEEFVK